MVHPLCPSFEYNYNAFGQCTQKTNANGVTRLSITN
ncbi:hypothetical protein IGB42_04276 [Andreprevotia sp. IGB-42]|nr:hypothetical protein IGB42_04276 [Andreprevotia sp. IGB-42]